VAASVAGTGYSRDASIGVELPVTACFVWPASAWKGLVAERSSLAVQGARLRRALDPLRRARRLGLGFAIGGFMPCLSLPSAPALSASRVRARGAHVASFSSRAFRNRAVFASCFAFFGVIDGVSRGIVASALASRFALLLLRSRLLFMSPFYFSDRPFDSLDFRYKAFDQFAGHMYEAGTVPEFGVGFNSLKHRAQPFPHLA